MTEQQYTRFTALVNSIDLACGKCKNRFKKETANIFITDSQNEKIQIKAKKYKYNKNNKYIRCLMISGLKELEKNNKKLDFDKKCDVKITFSQKKLIKNKKIFKKGVKNANYRRG